MLTMYLRANQSFGNSYSLPERCPRVCNSQSRKKCSRLFKGSCHFSKKHYQITRAFRS